MILPGARFPILHRLGHWLGSSTAKRIGSLILVGVIAVCIEVLAAWLYVASSENPWRDLLPELVLFSGTLVALGTLIVYTLWHTQSDQRMKLHHVFESTPNGLVLVDSAGDIHMINAAAQYMFGYSRTELIGKPVEILLDPSLAAAHVRHRQTFGRSPSSRAMGGGRDLFGTHKNGDRVPVEIGLNPLQTVDGRYTLAAVIDITERKAKEAQLEQQREALNRSNKALGEFASIAAHDMREPLRSIKGYAEMLLERGELFPDESDGKRLRQIHQEAVRLQNLVADLLSYAQVDAQEEDLAPTPLAAPLAAALETLYVAISETGASIVHDELPTVRGDHNQLTVLFQNLIENAIKYRGEVPPRISITATKDGPCWRVGVHDNGQGIPQQQREKVFEIFKRLHPRSHSPGTGLGLAICKKIVDRHGGRIWVEASADGGSSFFFTLPFTHA